MADPQPHHDRIDSITFVVIRPDGRILMQLRDDGRGTPIPYPNTWCLPGGGIERNERPIEAAVREAAEEYELRIEESECHDLLTYAHDGNLIDQMFLCPVPQHTVPKLHEGASFEWMTFEQIRKLTLAWEQNIVLDELESRIHECGYAT